MNMKKFRAIALALLVTPAAVYQIACGANSSPTSPTGNGGGGTGNVTIAIVGMNGNQSFSPSSATVSPGQTVQWVNHDSTTHRIVQDSGAFDTGNIAPGASSSPITINTSNPLPYHCSIHPSMVGAINGSSGPSGGGNPY